MPRAVHIEARDLERESPLECRRSRGLPEVRESEKAIGRVLDHENPPTRFRELGPLLQRTERVRDIVIDVRWVVPFRIRLPKESLREGAERGRLVRAQGANTRAR